MSLLFFPTRPTTHAGIGLPIPAEPCTCVEGPLIVGMSDTCLRCGHFTEDVIERTWHERAQAIAA